VFFAHVWMMPKSYLIRVTSARKKCWSRAIFPAGAAQVLQGTTRINTGGFNSSKVMSHLEFSLVKNLNLTIPPFLALLATISTIRPMHCLAGCRQQAG
jgi:hypothetical protein